MKAHLLHLSYVLRHKWYVFIECCRLGIPWLGVVHDLSKFRPSEWRLYALSFYGGWKYNERPDWLVDAFDIAWLHHQKRNRHHWQQYISGVGIVMSHDSATESHKLSGEKTPLGKIDAIRNPLKIVGIIESPVSAFGDYVINGRIPSRYQQIIGNGTSVSLSFKFIQEHLPKSHVIMPRCIPDDSSPMQKTELATIWQTLCAATYADSGCSALGSQSPPASSVCFSALAKAFRFCRCRFFSHLDVQSFQLLLPSRGHSSSAESHIVSLALNRMIGSTKDTCKYLRAIGGVSLSEDLLFFLCPRLCLSHGHSPDNDCIINNQHCQVRKQYWLLPGIKLLPMPDKYRREMLADLRGAGQAKIGVDDTVEWYAENKDKMQLHPATRQWIEQQLGIETEQ